MFVNLDADTAKELVIGGVGPIRHGSMFALDYVADTSWRVMWADSSLRSSPLWVNSGMLNGQFVVAGANVWTSGMDTLYGELHAYLPTGVKKGVWRKDSAGIHDFKLVDIDNDGRTNLVFAHVGGYISHFLADYESDTVTAGIDPSPDAPREFQLFQNYPNPFNAMTTIGFAVSGKQKVAIRVYDLLGRLVSTLLGEEVPAGKHSVVWDASRQSSGTYFYRLETASATMMKNMHLVK
jgi:hypothetical protein